MAYEDGWRPLDVPSFEQPMAPPVEPCKKSLGCLAVKTLTEAARNPQGEIALLAACVSNPEYTRHFKPSDWPLSQLDLELQALEARTQLQLPVVSCNHTCPAFEIL